MRLFPRFGFLTVLLISSACSTRDSQLESKIDVVGVAPLGGDLAYVQSSAVVQRLNVMGADPKPVTTKTAIRSNPRIVAKRAYLSTATPVDELMVVSDGTRDAYEQVLEAPALTVLDAQGNTRAYELAQSGQQLAQSPDGTFAVLFEDPKTTGNNALLSNPNEIAIVDLSKDPSSAGAVNPTIRTLDPVGGIPQAVWFARLKIAAQDRPFLLFSFPKGVSLIDPLNPTDPGHKIDLSNWVATSTGSTPVAEAVVDPDAAKIYLRNVDSPDVQVISVTASAVGSGAVDLSQNTLTVGAISPSSSPSSFAVYSQTDGTRLVATVGSKVAVVAADSNTVATVQLPYPANHIFTFDGTAPKDGTVRHRAVLYQVPGPGISAATGITFVNLEDLEQTTTKALQAVDLGSTGLGSTLVSILQLSSMPNSLLLFLQQGGIEILDLQTRHWSLIGSTVGITATVGDTMLNRAWVSASGVSRLGYLDFGPPSQPALTIGDVLLDNPIKSFFRMDKGDIDRVVVWHDQVGGAVTLLDAKIPVRPTAKRLEGFLLSDLL